MLCFKTVQERLVSGPQTTCKVLKEGIKNVILAPEKLKSEMSVGGNSIILA